MSSKSKQTSGIEEAHPICGMGVSIHTSWCRNWSDRDYCLCSTGENTRAPVGVPKFELGT